MAFSKVTLNGTTIMDVTGDTVDEENLLAGETATKANGVRTTGTLDLPVGVGEPYVGVDLTTKFSTEITTYSNNPWAWIKARITNGDYSGIHVGDYIPFTCTNQAATALNAKILGINTYTGSGNPAIGNHIDFMAGVWQADTTMNLANYNNGTSVSAYPWLASNAYLYANSLQGSVPSSASANPSMTAKNYQTDGIYYYLPSNLQNVIVTKRALLERRYTSGELLEESNNYGWTNIGKIWFPSEIEVTGTACWTKYGSAIGGSVQYPYFACNMGHRVFGGLRWFTLSPVSGSSSWFSCITPYGGCEYAKATHDTSYFPVCFRIA